MPKENALFSRGVKILILRFVFKDIVLSFDSNCNRKLNVLVFIQVMETEVAKIILVNYSHCFNLTFHLHLLLMGFKR